LHGELSPTATRLFKRPDGNFDLSGIKMKARPQLMNALGSDCAKVKTPAGVERTKIRRFSIMASLLFAGI
jgi:hypothetical protein